MQTEILLLVNLLGLDDPADETLDLGNEPDEDKRVGYVETSVEGGEHETQLGGVLHEGFNADGILRHRHVVAHKTADEIDEGTEDEEHPENTEEIKEHVRECRTACLGVGR